MKIGICIFTAQEFLTIDDYCGGEYRYLLKVAVCLSEMGHEVVVIIENNITKAVKFSRQTYGIETTKEMQILKEKMSFIRGLRIKLENINEALEDIWVHLIGTPYNEERGNLLKNMNIQTNNYFNYDEKAAKTLLMRMQ